MSRFVFGYSGGITKSCSLGLIEFDLRLRFVKDILKISNEKCYNKSVNSFVKIRNHEEFARYYCVGGDLFFGLL